MASHSVIQAARWLRRRIYRRGAYRVVARSGEFDAAHYLAANPDVAAAGMDPLDHYLMAGWREGRNPSPHFSTRGYLSRHADVRAQDLNPLVHYVLQGQREGRPVVTPAGEAIRRAPRKSRPRKALELLVAMLLKPSIGLHLARQSQHLGLRRAALLAWEAHAGSRDTEILPAAPAAPDRDAWLAEHLRVVPYHLNPHLLQDPAAPSLRLAAHLHLCRADMAERCIGYLRNIPARFDLLVSVSGGHDTAALAQRLAAALPAAAAVHVEEVPDRGRDLAPLIAQYGRRLADYDVLAHFHAGRGPDDPDHADWPALMETLCGSRSGVAQILDLLAHDAKTIYAAAGRQAREANSWGADLDIVGRILGGQDLGVPEDFPHIEFPRGAMFWARAGSVSRLLGLSLSFEDFPEEPAAPDGTLSHALERLILILAKPEPGRNYRLESPALSCNAGAYFEAQHDFSGEIVHDTVKVLAYYLPQFHPTPENSAWHGPGFTEWHKVRGATPLFHGHYQQHVPHPDIGYYHLDSAAQLARQAEQMRSSGVHGMIFYHYWFSGRLILEKPAQMLLAHPDVEMPFCFCWANENWTRRWDGNEREVLLAQSYSPQDAAAFIRYLIPFFRDERHIKVEGRPVLFVYRPSSVEGVEDYVRIWREECEAAGVGAPYLVAVLTRGASSPHAYGMDAGSERVLHDWLGPYGRDIRGELRPYWPLNGSVLDYGEVAQHYMQRAIRRDFPLFRSLVPAWDNTARYGSDAYLLHNFNTRVMQDWLGHLVRDAEAHLPADRRFVIVNAWNEWAEGAHLEPDTRFGYGYLNTIGRALSGHRFGALHYITVEDGTTLRLVLQEHARERLHAEPEALRKFVSCLTSSPVLARCRLFVPDTLLGQSLRAAGTACATESSEAATFTLQFSDLFLFSDLAVERMLQMALRYPGHAICASPLNDPAFLHGPEAANWQISRSQRTGMELRPSGEPSGHKICAEASCFRMGRQVSATAEQVATVIRYHGQGDQTLLSHALLSLLAQGGCHVQPYIGVQDVPEDAALALRQRLEALPWAEGCKPEIRFFQSTPELPDLRSVMLNEMLRAAGPTYVAFLDYDDLMFPNAYGTLLQRLQLTGKNATFGRVFMTTIDSSRGLRVRREVAYGGRTYSDFLDTNHAPIHSFMLDMRKVDISKIEYFQDMKFMEDYYLTLQIFSREDTDWESLAEEAYVGDYIHIEGNDANTLAVRDMERRRAHLMSPEYRLCEARLRDLRRRLQGGGLATNPRPAA